MIKKKILVAITARPSYSRIRSALEYINENGKVDLKVFCSGSALLERYGRVVDLIRRDGFDVAEEFYTFVEGNDSVNMALTTANTIAHTATLLAKYQPDYVVTIADRYETLGTAVAASYLGIPLIHIQGGEITGNIDEKVRHAVSKLADIHLVSNEQAGKRLERMGEMPQSIYVTGCPSIDLAREAIKFDSQAIQDIINELGVGSHIDIFKDFIVVLQHPETESYHQSMSRMEATLEAILAVGKPVLIFWPNVDAGSDATSKAIRVFKEKVSTIPVRYMKNLEGHAFLKLLMLSKCLIGNSSVGIRECAYLGIPVVNVGQRQAGRVRSINVLDVDWDIYEIKNAILAQLEHGKYQSSNLYGDGYSGKKIAEVIDSIEEVQLKRFYE